MKRWGEAVGTIFLSAVVVTASWAYQSDVNATPVGEASLADKSAVSLSCQRSLDMPRRPSREWRVATGIRASSWQWVEPAKRVGQVRVSVVNAEPGRAQVRPIGRIPTMTDPDQVAGRSATLAAINGDFFDTLPKGDALPQGALITDTRPIFVPAGWSRVVTWNANNRLRTTHVSLDASLATASQSWPVDALNDPTVRGRQIAVMNADWHRTHVPDGMAGVVVKGETVVARYPNSKDLKVPRGGYIIVADSVDALPSLVVDDRVELELSYTSSNHQDIVHAAGHGGIALREGQLERICSPYESIPRPRSMLAWNEDGRIWLLAASSGLPDAADGIRRGGLTKEELARVARTLGATTAVVLDGGGSTALFARKGAHTKRMDMPPESWLRPVPVVWQLLGS